MTEDTHIPLGHLRRLSDDTGILQHAKGPLPRRELGYTTDDNARALALAAVLGEQATWLGELTLGFLWFMQGADGWFHNLLGYDRTKQPENPSEDCQGRTLWALALWSRLFPHDDLAHVAGEMFLRGLPWAERMRSWRGMAWASLALAAACAEERPGFPLTDAAPARDVLPSAAERDAARRTLRRLLLRLHRGLVRGSGPGWMWWEPVLTYDNGILPAALMRASQVLGSEREVEAARGALDFLLEHTLVRPGHLRPVGNQGWWTRGGEPARFDQQPLDAWTTLMACLVAADVCDEQRYVWAAERSWRWFLGDNDHGVRLVHEEQGACYDGLTATGVNLNQGAESTLAWLLSQASMLMSGALAQAVA